MTNDQILEVLTKLDPANDAHWAKDGAPAMEAVNALAGGGLVRKQVLEAAPAFNRTAHTEYVRLLNEQQAAEAAGEKEVEGATEEALLGSDVQPNSFLLADNTEVVLGDVVRVAFESSGMSVAEWNAQAAEDREMKLQAVVDEMPLAEDEKDSAPAPVTQPTFATEEKAATSKLAKKEIRSREELEEVIETNKRNVAQLKGDIKHAEQIIADMQEDLRLAQEELEHYIPKTTNDQAIREYINSQAAIRMARVTGRQQMMAQLAAVSEVAPVLSPLDASMRRKNNRGGQRPMVPMKTPTA